MINQELFEISAFLPGIIYLGIRTSYTDIKKGVIKNRDILFGILYAVVVYSIIILFYIYTKTTVRPGYFIEFFSNCITALIIGFALWHFKIWSAADGKLFFAYSLLIPFAVYKHSYVQYFPSFVLLINVFMPFCLYAIPKILLFTPIAKNKEKIRQFKISFFINMLLVAFSMTWLTKTAQENLKLNINLFLSLLLIYIIAFTAQRIFKKFLTHVLVALIILRIVLDFNSITSIEFLRQSLFLSFILLFMYIITLLGKSLFEKEIDIKNLKKGMLPAETVYLDKNTGKYKKMQSSALQVLPQPDINLEILFSEANSEGLTEEHLKKIRGLQKKKKIDFSTLKIEQTMPFAPFVFLGVILTIIFRGIPSFAKIL